MQKFTENISHTNQPIIFTNLEELNIFSNVFYRLEENYHF